MFIEEVFITTSRNWVRILHGSPHTAPMQIAAAKSIHKQALLEYEVPQQEVYLQLEGVHCPKGEASLKDKIRNEIVLGWCNAARVSNIVSHRRLRWLGHLARMPDERLPKRVLF